MQVSCDKQETLFLYLKFHANYLYKIFTNTNTVNQYWPNQPRVVLDFC